jgi:protein TonB
VNLRWPLVSSVAALAAGFIIALLVVAFCGGNEEGAGGVTALTTPTATRTVRPTTRTPSPGTRTPTATATPEGEEPAEVEGQPPEESPVPPGQVPPEGEGPGETPTGPPAGETPIVGTPPPGVTPPPGAGTPAATKAPASPSPGPSPTPRPTSTPRPTATPTPPPQLPDLVVLDMWVTRDRIVVKFGNDGDGDLLVGQTVEVEVRGLVAETVVMAMPLGPGDSFNVLLEAALPVLKPERILARVDPNDLIPEQNDNNNALSKELQPDVPLDLAVVALTSVGSEQHLGVHVANQTSVPVSGAEVRVTVYHPGAVAPSAVAQQTLDLGPYEMVQIDVTQQVAVQGLSFRVVMDVMNLPDANPVNNTFEGVAL